MYKQYLALNNLQELIFHKAQPNHIYLSWKFVCENQDLISQINDRCSENETELE